METNWIFKETGYNTTDRYIDVGKKNSNSKSASSPSYQGTPMLALVYIHCIFYIPDCEKHIS